jgi:cephalosporin hydroxylase
MKMYGPLVTPGCYMVIEDTIVEDEWNCPPDWYKPDSVVKAIDQFMEERGQGWEREYKRKFTVTMHDGGWLRKR